MLKQRAICKSRLDKSLHYNIRVLENAILLFLEFILPTSELLLQKTKFGTEA